MKRRRFQKLKLLLSLLMFLACAMALLVYYAGSMKAQSDIAELVAMIETEEVHSVLPQMSDNEPMSEESPEATQSPEETDAIASIPTAETEHSVLQRYQKLYDMNSDLAGWVSIEGTEINYPVMYTPEEPEFYLHRNFAKEQQSSGLPFLDADCSIAPRSMNLVIYGHHMRDGSMFAGLMEYQNEAFYRAHPLITFDTIYEVGQYQIIGAFVVSVSSNSGDDLKGYYNLIDPTAGEFDEFMSALLRLRLYDTGETAEYGDSLLMLSTCEYSRSDGRMVVVAKKVG